MPFWRIEMKMKNSKSKFVGHWWVLTAVVFGAGLLRRVASYGQEAKPAPPAAAAKSDAPAKSGSSGRSSEPKIREEGRRDDREGLAEKPRGPRNEGNGSRSGIALHRLRTAAPSEKRRPAAAAAGTEEKATSKETAMPAGKTQPSVATKAIEKLGLEEQARSGWSPWLLGLVILALFVLPIMAGNYLAKIWRMPDHAWKISLVIGTFAASILICLFGEFKFGPDLAGGITLIYELAERTATVANQPQQQGGHADASQIKSGAREFTLDKLMQALKQRIDPDGTKEITIRGYGQAVLRSSSRKSARTKWIRQAEDHQDRPIGVPDHGRSDDDQGPPHHRLGQSIRPRPRPT